MLGPLVATALYLPLALILVAWLSFVLALYTLRKQETDSLLPCGVSVVTAFCAALAGWLPHALFWGCVSFALFWHYRRTLQQQG